MRRERRFEWRFEPQFRGRLRRQDKSDASLRSIFCGRSVGYGVPPEREWCRFSRKGNGINANCAIHRGFARSGGAKAGRQGKSLAVRPAYVAGVIEVFGERPSYPCQTFRSEQQ